MTKKQPNYADGRDEMNLADFPISALPRQQLSDASGQKLDRLEFEASRYDPVRKRRISQKVTLTTSARDGLPTPADEHVILGLLYVAKHSTNFAESTVHFAPGELFDIMRWSPNGRSYTRLRDVLRRLKSLTIRYENAWWDAAGRGYEEEVATGIISAYKLARQTSGPRTPKRVPESWVSWTPQFHESLQNGNLKRLDLDVFFSLSSPSAQRMYRFLDKRFYNTRSFSMDLEEFACGHIGLAQSNNVAVLKRRLQPALTELEKIGFLTECLSKERFEKIQAGQWRIRFEAGSRVVSRTDAKVDAVPAQPIPHKRTPSAKPTTSAPTSEAERLAEAFYRQWDPASTTQPSQRDIEQAQRLIDVPGESAEALLACLIQITKKQWPGCRSLSGAIQKYLSDAARYLEQQRARATQKEQEREQRNQTQQSERTRQQVEQEQVSCWQRLSSEEQQAIRQEVLRDLEGRFAPAAFVHRLCLEEAVRRFGSEAR